MRMITTALLTLTSATAALAHPGHIEPMGGHDHYVVVGAAGLAVAIGIGAYVVYRVRSGR